MIRIKNQIVAAWKWFLSFRKPEWDFNDYPIGTTEQDPDSAFKAPRYNQHRYRAYIINWPLTGSGETPEQARTSLRQSFETAKQNWKRNGEPPFRPARKKPLEFASQEKVCRNVALNDEFVTRILGLEWAWISDESSLWDFHTEQTNDLLHATTLGDL